MRAPGIAFVLSALWGVLGACGPSEESHVSVVRGEEQVGRWSVQVARTAEERREGLRLFGPLAVDEGLLLWFPGASEVCIQNRGVPQAIDIVFAEAGIVTAVESAEAEDDRLHCHRADRVLEVLAGSATTVVAGDGMRVENPPD